MWIFTWSSAWDVPVYTSFLQVQICDLSINGTILSQHTHGLSEDHVKNSQTCFSSVFIHGLFHAQLNSVPQRQGNMQKQRIVFTSVRTLHSCDLKVRNLQELKLNPSDTHHPQHPHCRPLEKHERLGPFLNLISSSEQKPCFASCRSSASLRPQWRRWRMTQPSHTGPEPRRSTWRSMPESGQLRQKW